jgi:UPF0755 protein
VLWFLHYALSPVNEPLGEKTVIIPKGSGFLGITEILDDAGLVENRPFFWALALAKGAARHIRAGEYEFAGTMSPNRIISKLVRGEIKTYTITLPEDITADEVAERLAARQLIDRQAFKALSSDRTFLRSLNVDADSLEGFLFPNTYYLDRSMTTQDILRLLVRQFWKQVTPEMVQRANSLGFTVTEWVTLASMIGKESGVKDEKTLISAVFHNRLKQGMKLQSDPTAVYRLLERGVPVRTVLRRHLTAQTPYNTYRITGLPPGPIANPGLDSLLAALHPAPVPYLYFVASADGGHRFSSTLTAHNRAVSQYQANKQKKP